MKTFALALLASTVLSTNLSAVPCDLETIDLVNNEVDAQGYTVAPGETLEFIFKENPTTGYMWNYDKTIVKGLYKVKSSYKQDKSCRPGMSGCGGVRRFKITAGPKEGDGIFYICNSPPWEGEVRYDVMRVGSQCEEIRIRV